jgi:hypothetical protein
LEMLEGKTKGNLTKQEEALLKQGLTTLRMAFVEAIDESSASRAKPQAQAPRPAPSPTPAEPSVPATGATAPVPSPAAPDESRKKFSKKY